MTERLTTLAAVKGWLGIDTTTSDAMLTRVIDAVSQFILQHLNRDSLAARTYTENFKGNGQSTMLLRNWPIIEVASLGVCGQQILPSTPGTYGSVGCGFVIGQTRDAPMAIELTGSNFYYRAPCQVVYTAGYRNTENFILIVDTPSANPVWVPAKSWTGGISAGDINGLYTQVDSNPVAGQFSIDPWGTYTFSYLDEGASLSVVYSFVPDDISFVACVTAAEWLRAKEHLGILSKTLGGQETITFNNQDISPSSKSILSNYTHVIPL